MTFFRLGIHTVFAYQGNRYRIFVTTVWEVNLAPDSIALILIIIVRMTQALCLFTQGAYRAVPGNKLCDY